MTSKIDIHQLPGGPLETNAWLVVEPASAQALVIDSPPETHDAIVAAVREHGVTVTGVVLTHTHWDHIVDARAIRASFGAPLIAHPNAVARLARPGSSVLDLPYTIDPITLDQKVDDGDELTLGSVTFTVMYAPGHDPSHIVLYSAEERVLLGGDVLFPGGHGRTDIPGSDQETMERTLARLLELPDDVTVYPGHGRTTTIGAERDWMTRMTAAI